MTNDKLTAMQSAWLDASTTEQGGESPNATDRGSFKCGFMMGANWAEEQKMTNEYEMPIQAGTNGQVLGQNGWRDKTDLEKKIDKEFPFLQFSDDYIAFLNGASWAEGAMHEKVSELRHNLQIAIRALSEIANWSDGDLGKYAVQALRDMGVEE
jgi:basic membrane lipoprotein Med (substrate-binding protein (PBP1-ABC) superfamily)